MEILQHNTTLWVAFSFVIFVALAVKFGGKGIIGALDKKIAEIKSEIETAERLKAEAQALLADFQTKQRDAEKAAAEIIELAVVDLDGNALIDTLILPISPIPAESTKIHGLVDADVVGAPPWRAVFPAVSELLRDRPIVVYNAGFDRKMIERCCDVNGLRLERAEWHCAMRSYAEWAGERSSHRRSRFRLRSLNDALAAFDLPAGNHRALGDALACRSLVIALAAVEGPGS